MTVEKPLQPVGETDDERVVDDIHGDGKSWPKIPYLKHEIDPLQPGKQPGSPALKDGWGGAPHDTHILNAKTDKE